MGSTGICWRRRRHQRRGAASLLLKKGADIAEEVGLDSYVVASTMGLPLYEKVGFRPIEGGIMRIELERYGGEGLWENTILKRPLHDGK